MQEREINDTNISVNILGTYHNNSEYKSTDRVGYLVALSEELDEKRGDEDSDALQEISKYVNECCPDVDLPTGVVTTGL